MIRPRLLIPALLVPFLALGSSCGPASATAAEEGGHEHDPLSVTAFGVRLLTFMEYPHLVRGESARFLAHFSVLATGEPVRSGTVTLEIGSFQLTVAAPKRDGLFLPEGSPPEAGTFPARLIVASEQASETLELGEIVVHADHASADAAAHAAGGEEPANAVPFLLEPQWKVRLLLARAGPRLLDERLSIPARAVVPEGSSALVSPAVGGRLLAPASGVLARTGERVEAGAVLALVEPLLGASELAELQALELELELQALEVLRAASAAETRLEFAQRERERVVKLRAEGLGTQPQLEQAEQNLALARAELEAAGRLREALDQLVARRAAASGAESGTALRFPLSAPIAGTLVEVRAVPGSSVVAGERLFRILDSARLWVEGRVSEFDAPWLASVGAASAEFAALPGRRFELRDAGGGPHIGAEVDPSSRTLLVRFELANADGAVRAGMLAELHLATGQREVAVAIPREAVIRDQGLATAYVMLEGELFQKRELALGAEDGDWVEVLDGIAAGERVATRGAYVVKLAALSPASFGAGHAH